MRLSIFFAAVVGLVAVLYTLGYQYSLLWHWWWYDSILHTLGGVAIGIFAVRLAQFFNTRDLMLVLGFGVFIGVGWELFEWTLGMPRSIFLNYAVDTIKDLVFDMTGAILGLLIARRI